MVEQLMATKEVNAQNRLSENNLFLKIFNWRSGVSSLFSIKIKLIRKLAATKKPAIIKGLSYPRSSPMIKEVNSDTVASVNKIAPAVSIFSLLLKMDSGSVFIPLIKAKIPIGTLIKKIYSQLKEFTINPPRGGPTMVPSATKVPDIPKAFPLSF